MCVLKCSNQVWLTLFISLTQVCSIFLHFVCYRWWWNKDHYNFTYLLACLPVVWQQAVASSGESERPSPDHSWTSSSRCFRRLAIQTSSCAKKWRWRSTSQSHVSRYTDTMQWTRQTALCIKRQPVLDCRAWGSGADPGSWQSACRWRES